MLDSYDEVIDWLFKRLPNYQWQGAKAYHPGLKNIKNLLQHLQNPEKFFPSIHVGGTNGKGSVSHMLASIYQTQGYGVGLFTSPHIHDFRERIKINGKPISKRYVVDFAKKNRWKIESIGASFFEITAALAFKAFMDFKVQIAIVEVGLGGRLDATNVVYSQLAIITNIGMDHTNFLGNTLEEIAEEKAGIIKRSRPVLIGQKQDQIAHIFEGIAAERLSSLYYAEHWEFELDILGRFQERNANTAYTATKILEKVFHVDFLKAEEGLRNFVENTNFKGRLQLIQQKPRLIVDAAHNPPAIENLMKEIEQLEYNGLHLVFGATSDKDHEAIFKLFPKEANYYFTEFLSKRSTKVKELGKFASLEGLDYSAYLFPQEALFEAKKDAKKGDLIVVFGSFYLLEEILY